MAGRSNRRRRSVIDLLYETFGLSQTLTIAVTIFITIFVLLFALSGIAIWPVVIKAAFSDTVFRTICRNILICDGVLLLLYIAMDAAIVWFADNVTFANLLCVNLALGGLLNMVFLLAQIGLLSGSIGSDFMLTLLWFIFSFLTTWVLTLLPSAITAGIANALHGYFSFLLNQER